MRTKLLSLLVVAGLVAMAGPGRASGSDEARRRGSCSGRGDWELLVRRETATSLRVRFSIEHVPPGHTWQLFLSDDGTGVYARSKVSTSDGEVRVRKIIADLAGTDRIKASGVDLATGDLCGGAVSV